MQAQEAWGRRPVVRNDPAAPSFPRVFFNEIDTGAADWMCNLQQAGHLPVGPVCTQSIAELNPDQVSGYRRCHFFAGIGGWELALRLASFPEFIRAWTGSCPCQPFSSAGKQKGEADERHLWPEFRRLIADCLPPVIFGEQVASKLGREWVSGKQNVQRLRDQQTIERILQTQDIPAGAQDSLQRLLSVTRTETQGVCPRCGKVGQIQSVPKKGESPGIAQCGQTQSEEEETFVKHFSQRSEADAFPWVLRIDRHPIQRGRGQDMGQPIPRSDRQFEGLRLWKCESGSLLRERNGKHVGAIKDIGDCRCDSCGEVFAIGLTAVAAGSEIARQFELRRSFAGVRADLEALGYAVGAADLCGASIGAPHIRQRLFWGAVRLEHARCRVADSDGQRHNRRSDSAIETESLQSVEAQSINPSGRVGDTEATRSKRHHGDESNGDQPGWLTSRPWGPDHCTSIDCLDGKTRRVPSPESGIQPLAYGIPRNVGSMLSGREGVDAASIRTGRRHRTGSLKGYGNAIIPQLAAVFVQSFMEVVS